MAGLQLLDKGDSTTNPSNSVSSLSKHADEQEREYQVLKSLSIAQEMAVQNLEEREMEDTTCNTPRSTIYLRNPDVATNKVESSEKPMIKRRFPNSYQMSLPSSFHLRLQQVNSILPKSYRTPYQIIRNRPSNAHLMSPPMRHSTEASPKCWVHLTHGVPVHYCPARRSPSQPRTRCNGTHSTTGLSQSTPRLTCRSEPGSDCCRGKSADAKLHRTETSGDGSPIQSITG